MKLISLAILALATNGESAGAVPSELDGYWALPGRTLEGPMVARAYREGFLVIRGDRFCYQACGGGIDASPEGVLRVDTSVSPKSIEFVYSNRTDPRRGPIRILGIYERNGDTLKLAVAAPGEPRPTGFDTPAGNEVWNRAGNARSIPVGEAVAGWQGGWEYVRAERAGKVISIPRATPVPDAGRDFLNVIGDRYDFIPPIGCGLLPSWKQYHGTIRADATRAPHEIDFISSDPGTAPMRGIYRIDGDGYRLCLGRPGEPRPRAFGVGGVEEVWRRVPKARIATPGASGPGHAPAEGPSRAATPNGMPEPPAPPTEYVKAAVRLHRRGDFALARRYLEAAEHYREMLTAEERQALDDCRTRMPQAD